MNTCRGRGREGVYAHFKLLRLLYVPPEGWCHTNLTRPARSGSALTKQGPAGLWFASSDTSNGVSGKKRTISSWVSPRVTLYLPHSTSEPVVAWPLMAEGPQSRVQCGKAWRPSQTSK